MYTDRESHVVRFLDEAVQLFLRPEWQAPILDIVVIWINHRGAAAAERAVDLEFDRRDCQAVVAVGMNRRADRIEIPAGTRHHGVNTHCHFVIVGHRQIGFGFGDIDSGIVHACQAERGQLPERCQKRLPVVFPGWWRNLAGYQAHRIVDQRAGCMPIGITQNFATDRVRCVVVDAGDLHRLGVCPTGMAIYAP